MTQPLGISGKTARAFQNSAITPLLAIVGLLLGFFATFFPWNFGFSFLAFIDFESICFLRGFLNSFS